ncbi:MAG: CDC48 family AAA ATPase [Candidatus Aenigmarchaeota archaeon]|nr:CDC48 family AAA ATPase [Candidatus Aenigmarchaeota archaeon]
MGEILLEIAESSQVDVGKSIARISTSAMNELGVVEGDILYIKGKSKTVAIAKKAYYDDEERIIIRIDGYVRTNAGSSVGEEVSVEKADAKKAKELKIAPFEQIQFNIDPREIFLERIKGRPFVRGDNLIIEQMGNTFEYLVARTKPSGCVVVDENTKLIIDKKSAKRAEKIPEMHYEDIGGLKEEIDKIREMIELPMKHPEVFERVGISAPKGVLLTGPPGCGKTLLARAVASETEANFISINGPEIMGKYHGQSEENLRNKFEEAQKDAPSIIFIDEIDAIAPKRQEAKGEVERRVVAQLLTLMDGLKSRGDVVVIAATNLPDDIDIALRRPGRFDRELKISPPNFEGRKEILQVHTRRIPIVDEGEEKVNIDKLAKITIGYSGADLESLSREAAMRALKKYFPPRELAKLEDEKIPINILEKIKVKMSNFIEAFKSIEPSAMREVLIKKPDVKFSDIGGLENIKQKLREMIEWPLTDKELFKKAGIHASKGILLYGPPGCGKTLIAKAIANNANANFISIKGPELVSKWVGESEKHIRELFKKAKEVSPAIIFFDEFDSIASVRSSSSSDSNTNERIVNQLLTELDGIEELTDVVVIAATNRIDLIDKALLRPGRLDEIIKINMPDEDTRERILKVHVKNMPLEKKMDLKKYASKTKNFSGADLSAVVREAGMEAIREAKKNKSNDIIIREKHFKNALEKINKNPATGLDKNN